MMRSPVVSTPDAKLSGYGVRGFLKSASKAWTNSLARVAPGLFPPEVVVQVKALACELPAKFGVPLSRWSTQDLAAQVRQSGLVASISGITVWRWLHEDALRPWQHRCWIFPRHEYTRCGAWAYLAALDVHRAKLFGRCEKKNGIKPFDRLVDDAMTQPPYNEARRVFWIVDNGSSHRGHACATRLRAKYPRLVLVNGPIHASWLNQVEIYFSILQRKALTPNDFSSLEALEQRLIGFQHYYERIAKPFQWKFTRDDLTRLLEKIPLAA